MVWVTVRVRVMKDGPPIQVCTRWAAGEVAAALGRAANIPWELPAGADGPALAEGAAAGVLDGAGAAAEEEEPAPKPALELEPAPASALESGSELKISSNCSGIEAVLRDCDSSYLAWTFDLP